MHLFSSRLLNNKSEDLIDSVVMSVVGFYGSENATRHCMTITEIGGNFPMVGRNQTDETNIDLR